MEARLNKTSSNSYICANHEDWFTIWLSLEELLPYIIGCWADNIALEYSPRTRSTHSPEGVEVRVRAPGDLSTVDYLEYPALPYFTYLTSALTRLGYVRNRNLRAAPYDFRKAPNELGPYFASLRALMEEMTVSTRGPLVVVVHSNGAPLLNYFLSTVGAAWRRRHVGGAVALAGAWGGAVKTLKVYAAGDNLNYRILNPAYIRAVERSFPSLSFLLPDPQLWGDATMVEYAGNNFTMRDIDAFFRLMNLSDAVAMHEDTSKIFSKSGNAPKVPLHCLYGVGVETVEGLRYASEAYFPSQPILVNGDGDGTVNRRSAELCHRYAHMQAEPVTSLPIEGTEHNGILSNPIALQYVVDLVTKEAEERTKLHDSSGWFEYVFSLLSTQNAVSLDTPDTVRYVESELNLTGLIREINEKAEQAFKVRPIWQKIKTQIKLREKLDSWIRRAHELDFEKLFGGSL